MFVHPFLPERESAAFLMCADLLTTVPAWRIRAGADTSIQALADLIAELPSLADDRRVERVA